MACFLAPTAAAVVTTALKKKFPPAYRLDWLAAMLWGGTIMLIVDHVANGEVVFTPPFFTAAPGVIMEEVLRVGVLMTLAVVLVWAVGVVVAARIKKKEPRVA